MNIEWILVLGKVHMFVNLKDRSLISTSVTIVRRWEDRHDLVIMHFQVSLNFKQEESRLHPSQVNELWLFLWGCSDAWTAQRSLFQKGNRLLWATCPRLERYCQGQTIEDHTLALHAALLALCPGSECCRDYQDLARVLHAAKISEREMWGWQNWILSYWLTKSGVGSRKLR